MVAWPVTPWGPLLRPCNATTPSVQVSKVVCCVLLCRVFSCYFVLCCFALGCVVFGCILSSIYQSFDHQDVAG